MARNLAAKQGRLSNSDVLLIGVWKSGGGDRFIDIEDAYAVCWELTPHRFSWRTRNDLPNTKKLNKALSDFAKRDDPPLVRQGSYKVRLSSAGLEWIQEHERLINSLIGTESEKIAFSSNQASRQLNRFKKTPLFGKWQTDPEMNPEKWELALALRCSSDSPSSVWFQRIETLRADAQLSNDSEVLRFIDLMLEKEPGWFKED
jgi:hypothetical protein